MKRGVTKTLLVLSLTVFVLLLSIPGTVNAGGGTQTWYLDSANHTVISGVKVMEKDSSQVGGTTSVLQGESLLWCADEAATVDVTFPASSGDEQGWVVEIATNSDWGKSGSKCGVDIGYADADCEFVSFSTSPLVSIYSKLDKTIIKVQLQGDSVTVPEGYYLAVKICNNDTTLHTVYTAGYSTLSSPENDPGYPVPEVAAGVLFGIGGLGLLSYILVRSRKQKVSL